MVETVRAPNNLLAFIKRHALFPLNIDDPLYAEKHTCNTADGKILGVGALKLTAEAILVLDSSMSRLSRAKTVEELILTAIYKSQQRGLDEVHAFLTGPDAVSLASMLKKHFAFEDIVGIPLVMKVR